ncbi:hypothetical protein SAMN02745751_00047 [Dethiosulfatibacter aminovorans DSM 17477]|uniref:Uncharacterized protein n=1 Tax=Dethiosulfatibacter aminovorans DSM 17477 TaxID=1121476 RepID=A0A1M6AAF9_9FIRM|nr:hypothetical protein SAMN02745751_00047 [Dethiosulfatibacter aminovorans DSM 17477]
MMSRPILKILIFLFVIMCIWNICIFLLFGDLSRSYGWFLYSIKAFNFRFSPKPLLFRIENNIELIFKQAAYHQKNKIYYCRDRDSNTYCFKGTILLFH